MKSVEIILNVQRKGDKIICNDMNTLCLVMGTKSIGGNLSMYKVTKNKNNYEVNVNTIKERILILESRKEKIGQSIDLMRQVIA